MSARKPKTRAQLAGVSAAVLARKARRFSEQTRERVREIAYEWDELFSGVDSEATSLERALDQFDEAMKEAVEYIKEAPEES